MGIAFFRVIVAIRTGGGHLGNTCRCFRCIDGIATPFLRVFFENIKLPWSFRYHNLLPDRRYHTPVSLSPRWHSNHPYIHRQIDVDKKDKGAVSNSVIMRIGLMSDTHMPVDAQDLPAQLKQIFCDVDLILHAGDVYAASVLDELGAIAPLLASKGDDDYGAVLADERMKEKHVLTFQGITIWLFHEFTRESWMDSNGIWKMPPDETHTHPDPDVVVFGHTHRAALDNRGSVLTVTPGSATFPNYRREPGTVGLLEIRSGNVEARIIQLQDVR